MRTLADIYESCNFCTIEPTSFEEAIREDVRKKAMEEEIHMIEKNDTWQLVERPKNKEVVGVKWIYRIKHKSDGSWLKIKARLVAKGYSQHKGVDYFETFAPVARKDTI